MSLVQEAPLIQNTSRHFSVGLLRCIVTEQLDKCIRVKLAEVPWNDDGSGRSVEVYGQFSAEGLRSLLSDLEAAPPPLTLPTPDTIRQGTAYQWKVRTRDCRVKQQFNDDGSENPFAQVRCEEVVDFFLVPRDTSAGLPVFCLSRLDGFLRGVTEADGLTSYEHLDLPFPKSGEFQLNYYRRITISFTNLAGQNEVWPTHCKQVLGWQVGDPESPTILEIAVEDDGSWQIYKKENVVMDDTGTLVI